MDEYRHYVSGFSALREDAESVSAKLALQGLPIDRLQINAAATAPSALSPPPESSSVLKELVVGGTIGAGIGALAEMALAAANVSLFIASPLIAPLVLLGWGAGLGGRGTQGRAIR